MVSDTHGRVHPGVFDKLAGVDRILHAGDVGDESVLADLEAIAPVACVRGNVDEESGLAAPLERLLDLDGTRVLLIHQAPRPDALPRSWRERLARDRVRVVVCGHTHEPHLAERGSVLFLNPGGCGRPRFGLPLSVARLVPGEPPRAEILRLS